MKKIITFLTVIFFTVNAFAANGDKWTQTFVVTSGEEISLGLAKGTLVRITNEKPTYSCGTYFLEVLPFGPNSYLSKCEGMGGLTYAYYRYDGKSIKVEKNSQRNPSRMQIGSCELRAQD